ncbi:MAG: type II toxin-antitoxin system VapC family toxin [Candidatus Omnitrophica bacterium]|nr:type II toxin-antitoxin system VapC family toxin [Candidatus Omnitrophota bacterium]
MKLIDSSGWLEFFTDGPLAQTYASYLKNPHEIVTPSVVLYEVYKVIKRLRTEEEALAAAAQIGKTRLVPLDDQVALTAADVSLTHRLAMADSIIYATALMLGATLVTSDGDLAELPGVTYLKKS